MYKKRCLTSALMIRIKMKTSLTKAKKCTWFDSESEDEITHRVMTFTRKCESEGESCDEDMTEEKLTATYRFLYTKWEKVCTIVEQYKKTIGSLHKEKEKLVSTITGLEKGVNLLNSKPEHMSKNLRILNSGSIW